MSSAYGVRVEHIEPEVLRETFGQQIRIVREQRNLTQTELAEKLARLGMTRDKIAKIERGNRPTALEEAAALAHALGVPLESLMVPPRQANIIVELEKMTRELRLEFENVVGAVQSLVSQRAVLDAYLRTPPVREESSDLGVKRRLQASQAMEQCTLEQAIRTGVWREEQDRIGEAQADEILQTYGSMEEFMKQVTDFDGDE